MSAVPPDDPFAPSVQRLVRAIESKDSAAIEAAFPGITPDQRRAFTTLFDHAKDSRIRINAQSEPASRSDGEASGTITLGVVYTDPGTLARVGPLPYRYDVVWEERADGQWYLKSLKTIP
jgi:hypothetical protein